MIQRLKDSIPSEGDMSIDDIMKIMELRRSKHERDLSSALLSYKANQKNKLDALCRGRFVVASVAFTQPDGVLTVKMDDFIERYAGEYSGNSIYI